MTTDLRRGLAVNLLSPGCARTSVQICTGTVPMADAAGRRAYPGAVIPRGDWRPLRPSEEPMVCAVAPERLSASVSVVDFGDGLVTRARALLGAVDGRVAVPAGAAVGRDLAAVHTAVLEHLAARHGVEPLALGAVDLVVNQPHLPSTAFHEQAQAFLGLHLDSHENLPLERRDEAMTLCAVNVGFTDRYLNFVNLPVRQLSQMLAERAVPGPETAPRLKDLFFATFPDYPVLRLRIPPGQAYLCNTQNVIHDGATNDAGLPDVALLTMNRLRDGVPVHAGVSA